LREAICRAILLFSRDGRVASHGKGHFSQQELRERVDQVMDAWQSYPDFAHLFDALLDANNISAPAFAQQYSQITSAHLRGSELNRSRRGQVRASYPLVASIADHAMLSFNPERMRPGGDHRIALFAAAGLIEVTPDSIKQWNEEVLARLQRQRDQTAAGSRIIWKELMGKLLSFHCQGGRWSRRDIANAANGLPGSTCTASSERIKGILSDPSAVPTCAERLPLEKVASLDAAQINAIETAVEDRSLPLVPDPSPIRFSAQLNEILGRLGTAGITQRQLVLRTIPFGQSEPEFSNSALSLWKHGKANPTLTNLRALVTTLERCHYRANRPLVTADEIRQLVTAAGFSLDDLSATTHDIVARINETTRLKPLLSTLRNAAYLNVPMSAIDSDTVRCQAGNGVRMGDLLNIWEWDGSPYSPTPEQLGELLARYNRLLRDAGHLELNAKEMQEVLGVAQRDREDGQQRGFCKRLQ
jgi:hypothetical protein